MPLTPAHGDPNKERELKRKVKDPASFGVTRRDHPMGKDRKTATQLKMETDLVAREEALQRETAALAERETAVTAQEKKVAEDMAVFNEAQKKVTRKAK